MPDFSAKKLGKLAPKLDSKRLKLAKYVKSTAPPPPSSVDWTGGTKNWGELGNDTLGDCTVAGVAHAIQVWMQSNGIKWDDTVSQDVAVHYYELWCGYNPSDMATDQGGIEVDVLNDWRKETFAGHKLLGYADPELWDLDNVKRAIYELGGVYIGLQLPASAMTQSRWEVSGDGRTGDSKPGSWGGHAVFCPAYNKQDLVCITWGEEQTMSWEFFLRYADEAHALFGDAWVSSAGAPNGLDTEQLLVDLTGLGKLVFEEDTVSSRIMKISGNFVNLGDALTLTVPAKSHTVALRLYEETQEVAIFYMTNAPAQFATTGLGIVAQDTIRQFRTIAPESDLPPNFIKYVGAMGLRVPATDDAPASIVQVLIIEEAVGG